MPPHTPHPCLHSPHPTLHTPPQCSATGATFCYLLSAMVGQKLVTKYFPERLNSWRAQISHHHDDMLWYIIFLRITPFLPNWFINLASPLVGVRLAPFYWGTFLGEWFIPTRLLSRVPPTYTGVAPPSFFFIRAGTTLYELTMTSGHISWGSLLLLGLLAGLSLLPVLLRKSLRNKVQ